MTAAAARQEVAKPKEGRAKRPGKPRKTPVTLPQGDYGPDTPAQMERAEVIPLFGRGGDWHGKRRVHRLHIMARPKGRRRQAEITPRQLNAGMELFNRWERRQMSGEPVWCRPVVDGGRTGEMEGRLLREAAYRELIRVVPRRCLPIVRHVVLHQRPIMPDWTQDRERAKAVLADLGEALDAVADRLRL